MVKQQSRKMLFCITKPASSIKVYDSHFPILAELQTLGLCGSWSLWYLIIM
jgi:hypothetical protein